jgi:glycosyltransferase involved in cell wall biosynthesis
MNILSITSSYPRYAGDPTAPFIESITKHVAALGHTVHLVVPEHSAWRRPASEDGVHYHPYRYSPMRSWTPWGYSESLRAGIQIRRRLYPLSPLIALSAIRTCNAVARRVPIDVIHAHWVIPNGPLAAVAARQHDVPLVVSVHGSDVALSERSRWMGSLTRRTFAQAFAVTAASRHMLDRAADLGARPETLHLIPYGMDLSSFQPDQQAAARVREALRLLPEDVLVLGIGRLIEWKGFGYLIQAIPLAQEKVPNIRLVIAGDGDLRAELEAQAQRLGLEDRVTFVGSVQRRDVPGFFAAADMVVVPSIRHEAGFVEALGYVVHEALATGTPVIASRVGGLPEVVGDGETGYLVEERDPEALAGAIATLASNQDLRMKMGVRARARALAEPHSLDGRRGSCKDTECGFRAASRRRSLVRAPAAEHSRTHLRVPEVQRGHNRAVHRFDHRTHRRSGPYGARGLARAP